MVQVPSKTISLEEFLQLPETEPASEYIEGQIIRKPMPQGKHSKLQGKFVMTINSVLEEAKVALALPELRCTFGGRSIIPDVSVFTWQRIPVDENGDIANVFQAYPDWTIEILSPDQNQTKVTNNILHCLRHGTQMGWLVDPEQRSILTYPQGQQPDFFEEADQVPPTPAWADAVTLTVGTVFSWLQVER